MRLQVILAEHDSFFSRDFAKGYGPLIFDGLMNRISLLTLQKPLAMLRNSLLLSILRTSKATDPSNRILSDPKLLDVLGELRQQIDVYG